MGQISQAIGEVGGNELSSLATALDGQPLPVMTYSKCMPVNVRSSGDISPGHPNDHTAQ
jgi:hypothetical protein